jgi:hypothetical protein
LFCNCICVEDSKVKTTLSSNCVLTLVRIEQFHVKDEVLLWETELINDARSSDIKDQHDSILTAN